MAEVDERTLDELRAVRNQLMRAELADDRKVIADAHARLVELVDARVLGHLLASATPRRTHAGPIRLPVPYYGGKFAAALLIERAMGPIVNLVIPFGGSLGCLLGRSTPARVETANDKDGLIVNAWRAIKHDPYAVAEACALPVHDCTLMAVHQWLLDKRAPLTELLGSDPTAFDVQAVARLESRCAVATRARALARAYSARRSATSSAYFAALADRLAHVRLTCADRTRVLTKSVTISHGVTGVYLDPCYALETGRKPELYGLDEPEQSAPVRAWALEHGEHPRLRLVVSGLEDEHAELEAHGRSVIPWRERERLWLSPHCRVDDFGPLFSGTAAA